MERIYGSIRDSISSRTIQGDLHFKRLPNVIAKLVAVLGILVCMVFWYLFLGQLTCISRAYLLCNLIGEPILRLSYLITVFISQISNLALLYDFKFSLEIILLFYLFTRIYYSKSMILSNLCQNLLDPNHIRFSGKNFLLMYAVYVRCHLRFH